VNANHLIDIQTALIDTQIA